MAIDDRNTRDNSGTVIFGIVAVIVLLIIVYFLFLRGDNGRTDIDIDLDRQDPIEQVEPPAVIDTLG